MENVRRKKCCNGNSMDYGYFGCSSISGRTLKLVCSYKIPWIACDLNGFWILLFLCLLRLCACCPNVICIFYILHISAIVSFSMESFRKDSPGFHGEQKQKSKLGPGVQQIVVNLPADYGRRPLSEDEMDIINVSIVQNVPMYTSLKCPGLEVGISMSKLSVENNPVWLGE